MGAAYTEMMVGCLKVVVEEGRMSLVVGMANGFAIYYHDIISEK